MEVVIWPGRDVFGPENLSIVENVEIPTTKSLKNYSF